jgi:hypothetical protein
MTALGSYLALSHFKVLPDNDNKLYFFNGEDAEENLI